MKKRKNIILSEDDQGSEDEQNCTGPKKNRVELSQLKAAVTKSANAGQDFPEALLQQKGAAAQEISACRDFYERITQGIHLNIKRCQKQLADRMGYLRKHYTKFALRYNKLLSSADFSGDTYLAFLEQDSDVIQAKSTLHQSFNALTRAEKQQLAKEAAYNIKKQRLHDALKKTGSASKIRALITRVQHAANNNFARSIWDKGNLTVQQQELCQKLYEVVHAQQDQETLLIRDYKVRIEKKSNLGSITGEREKIKEDDRLSDEKKQELLAWVEQRAKPDGTCAMRYYGKVTSIPQKRAQENARRMENYRKHRGMLQAVQAKRGKLTPKEADILSNHQRAKMRARCAGSARTQKHGIIRKKYAENPELVGSDRVFRSQVIAMQLYYATNRIAAEIVRAKSERRDPKIESFDGLGELLPGVMDSIKNIFNRRNGSALQIPSKKIKIKLAVPVEPDSVKQENELREAYSRLKQHALLFDLNSEAEQARLEKLLQSRDQDEKLTLVTSTPLMGQDLFVMATPSLGTGMGLFTASFISAADPIVFYEGEVFGPYESEAQLDKAVATRELSYALQYEDAQGKWWLVDAQHLRGTAAFCNDIPDDCCGAQLYNVQIEIIDDKPCLCAISDIPAGSQLILSYNRTYQFKPNRETTREKSAMYIFANLYNMGMDQDVPMTEEEMQATFLLQNVNIRSKVRLLNLDLLSVCELIWNRVPPLQNIEENIAMLPESRKRKTLIEKFASGSSVKKPKKITLPASYFIITRADGTIVPLVFDSIADQKALEAYAGFRFDGRNQKIAVVFAPHPARVQAYAEEFARGASSNKKAKNDVYLSCFSNRPIEANQVIAFYPESSPDLKKTDDDLWSVEIGGEIFDFAIQGTCLRFMRGLPLNNPKTKPRFFANVANAYRAHEQGQPKQLAVVTVNAIKPGVELVTKVTGDCGVNAEFIDYSLSDILDHILGLVTQKLNTILNNPSEGAAEQEVVAESIDEKLALIRDYTKQYNQIITGEDKQDSDSARISFGRRAAAQKTRPKVQSAADMARDMIRVGSLASVLRDILKASHTYLRDHQHCRQDNVLLQQDITKLTQEIDGLSSKWHELKRKFDDVADKGSAGVLLHSKYIYEFNPDLKNQATEKEMVEDYLIDPNYHNEVAALSENLNSLRQRPEFLEQKPASSGFFPASFKQDDYIITAEKVLKAITKTKPADKAQSNHH